MSATIYRGNQVGWGDISAGAFGGILDGITELTYEVESDEELLYGAGRGVQGIGIGNVKPSGGCKMYRWQANEILTAAASKDGLHTISVFALTVTAITENEQYTDVVTCKIKKTGRSLKQGDKMDIVDAPFTVVGVQFQV